MPFKGGGGIGGPRRRTRRRSTAPYDPGKRRAAEGKKQPNRGRPTQPATPAPKPDVTLGGDKTPKRSGHARAQTRSTPRPDVTLGGDRNRRTGHQSSSRRERKRARKERQQKALMRYTRAKLSGFKEPMRDKDTKILGVNVEAELEGRGVLPKIGKKVGDLLAPTAGKSLRAGGIPVPDKVADRAVRDAASMAANLPSGLYLTGAAAKEAAGGDTKRAKELFESYKKTSAVSEAVSAVAGKGSFKEAAKRAQEHPITTALELSGGKALIGRNAGRLARAGAFGKRGKRAASLERADLRLTPEYPRAKAPREKRQYSKDIITKGAQVAAERRARRKGHDPNVDTGQALVGGQPLVGSAGVKGSRATMQGRTPHRSRLMRRIDTRVFAGERVRKERIKAAKREASKITPVGRDSRFPGARRKGQVSRDEAPLVHLMAEKTVTSVKTARAELRARLRHLDRQYKVAASRDSAFARANRAEADHIRALLDLDDTALNRVYVASREFADQEASRQARLRESGQYTVKEQSARWFPYLQSHHRLEGKQLREAAVKLEQGAERIKVGNKIIRRPKEEPAFITQRPVTLTGKGTAPEAYQPAMQGVGASAPPGGKRRGTAYDLGAREVGSEALVRQAIMSEGRASAGENFQLLANEFGVPAGKGGRLYAESYSQALEHGRALTEDSTGALKPGHVRLVPVNIDGLRGYGDKLAKLQERSRPGAMDDALGEALAEALSQESGKGRWVLMPEDVVARLRQHADVRTSDLQGVTNVFKDVVLTSSSPTTWLTGNISDLGFRSIMEGIRPTDVMRGRMIVRQMETKGTQGEQAAAALAGGGFFHSSSMAERFNPGRMNEAVARTIAAAPWRAWKGGVYALEHFIEELPQFGRIGKAARQGDLGAADLAMQNSLRSLLRMQDEQIDFYATRLSTDRALEARIQQLTEDVIGRWGKVSPRMRKHLSAAPFVQWLGAALRYTLVTLPVRHPVKTAIFAGIIEMTEEERARLGLSYLIPQDQRVQDYQMGTLPMSVKIGKHGLEASGIRTGNLTSFGTAGQAILGQNLPAFMLPQLRGVFGALTGQGYTGEDMVYPDWWPDESLRGLPLSAEDRRQVAIGSLLEVGVPFASAFRRIVLEKGNSSLPQSTILSPQVRKHWDKQHKDWRSDEGTLFGGISEWLNPINKNRLITHGDVRSIRENQEAGAVFGRMRDKSDAKIRKQGGEKAVKVNRQLRANRAKMEALPQDSPERYKRYLRNRHLSQQLANLTGGKAGHDYKTAPKTPDEYANPYGKHGGSNPYGGDTSDNPYLDNNESNPYVDSNESNPYSSGSGSNPYAR